MEQNNEINREIPTELVLEVVDIKECQTKFGTKIKIDGVHGECYFIAPHNVYKWLTGRTLFLKRAEANGKTFWYVNGIQ